MNELIGDELPLGQHVFIIQVDGERSEGYIIEHGIKNPLLNSLKSTRWYRVAEIGGDLTWIHRTRLIPKD